MFHSANIALGPGAALAEIAWSEAAAVAVGAGAIGALLWLLWRAQRLYALDLAEQARQVADEQENAKRARDEMEAVGRESQAKSEMLATLSREIRGHLNGIIGSADLMLDSSLQAEQRRLLGTLRSSAESLHQSLNDVLDYSSIETGQIKIAHSPFDLRQPLIEVLEILSPIALLKGLELVLIVAPDAPAMVSGDASRLRQVLLNLMANAVRFTAGGRVVLRVELPPGSSAVSKDGATWLHFSVSDTGAGIPEEMQATIFERFAHSDAPSARKFGGSGLELAICRRLVELMGGQIGARSLAEGGSEFWVVLGLVADKAQAPALPPSPPGLHVAVLDDLPASRLAASSILTRIGVDHDAVDTVDKAMTALREAREAGARELVLLLNESVAKEEGGELARILAEDTALRETRVVLMSRNPEETALFALKFPVTAVVRKPLLRSEVLLEALKVPRGAGARVSGSRAPFEPAGAGASGGGGGPRVLVVDDDEISRSVSSQLLSRMGCAVEAAGSGATAIELARNTPFELILMDCQMPEMDGFATTAKILAEAGSKAPPIVALTANISAQDRERCFAAGMSDFVGKPARRPELARILRRWTHLGRAPRDEPGPAAAIPGATSG